MEPFGSNPFAVLTFIVAPAVLTNASSVMGMQTANRFSRAVDRARQLASLIDGASAPLDPQATFRLRQLEFAERRVLLLVRALTSFYVSVGGFAAASFFSLLGAIFVVASQHALMDVALILALCAGVTGLIGLLSGSGILVWETRHSLSILADETRLARERRAQSLLGGTAPPQRAQASPAGLSRTTGGE